MNAKLCSDFHATTLLLVCQLPNCELATVTNQPQHLSSFTPQSCSSCMSVCTEGSGDTPFPVVVTRHPAGFLWRLCSPGRGRQGLLTLQPKPQLGPGALGSGSHFPLAPCQDWPVTGGREWEAGALRQCENIPRKKERFECRVDIHGEGQGTVASSSNDLLPLFPSVFFFFMFRAQIDPWFPVFPLLSLVRSAEREPPALCFLPSS